jgi:hypothetical protein
MGQTQIAYASQASSPKGKKLSVQQLEGQLRE